MAGQQLFNSAGGPADVSITNLMLLKLAMEKGSFGAYPILNTNNNSKIHYSSEKIEVPGNWSWINFRLLYPHLRKVMVTMLINMKN